MFPCIHLAGAVAYPYGPSSAPEWAFHGVIILQDQTLNPPSELAVLTEADRIRQMLWASQPGKVAYWTTSFGAAVEFFQWGDDLTELSDLLSGERQAIEDGVADIKRQLHISNKPAQAHIERPTDQPDAFLGRLTEQLGERPYPYAVPLHLATAGTAH